MTLPFGPSNIRYTKAANKETLPVSGDDPINIVDGFSQDTVQLEGAIADHSLTDAQLWSTYLSPLLGLVGTEVSCTSTDGSIDGDWLLESFEHSRDGATKMYHYTMRLCKGSINITLG